MPLVRSAFESNSYGRELEAASYDFLAGSPIKFCRRVPKPLADANHSLLLVQIILVALPKLLRMAVHAETDIRRSVISATNRYDPRFEWQ